MERTEGIGQNGQVAWRNGRARMLKELTKHGNVLRACRDLNLSRSRFYEWQDEDPAYKAAVRKATDAGHRGMYDCAIDHVYRQIEEEKTPTPESVRIALKVLGSIRPDIWSEKARVEVSGPDGAAIEVNDVSKSAIASEALGILRSLGFTGRDPDPE